MEAFMGQIIQVGFNFAPPGWSTCQGQLIPVNQNPALFALLGVTFGGNGSTNFQLPNAQSRVFVGAGQGAGLSPYPPGQMGGSEQVTLTSGQMPMHAHPIANATGGMQAVTNNNAGSSSETPAAGSLLGIPYDSDGGTVTVYVPADTPGATTVNLGGVQITGNTGVAGGSQPVPVLPPYLAITTLICMQGIYPVRS